MPKVVGYHGCTREFADGVRTAKVAMDQRRWSQNVYDWLGEGIYFWESSRSRAMEWAVKRFAEHADVLEAEIDLGRCLDLLESTYHNSLRETYRSLRFVYRRFEWSLPKNRNKRHELDCLVINQFVELANAFAQHEKLAFQTVRGVFEEGRPIFPGSALRSESHVQIAVRDIRCIRILSN